MPNPEKNKAAEELKILDYLKSILSDQKIMYLLLCVHLILINTAFILLVIKNSRNGYAASVIISVIGLIIAIISFRINDKIRQKEVFYKKHIIRSKYAGFGLVIDNVMIPDTKKRLFTLWFLTAVYLILILSGSILAISYIKAACIPDYLIAPGL